MNNSLILHDAYGIYYNKGMNALKANDLDRAGRNILLAAETMLKLAKESDGELKDKRIKRADELYELYKKIKEKNKIVKVESFRENSNEEFEPIKNISKDSLSVEEALKPLESLEGLEGVKRQVSDLIAQIKVFQMRKSNGLPTPEMSYHMVFTGNPGTGKTTVARIIGQIYHALGILSKGHLVEVDRSDLVAGYVGQTALKTKAVISKAMGGILFIDEAYSLKKEGNDFGQEAIDTLNKAMEDSRNDLVVIVAGYKDEIKSFIDSNKGLRSRFRKYIDFKDYTGKELYNIFKGFLQKEQFLITKEADNCIYCYLNDKETNHFTGNARDVRNLYQDIIEHMTKRVVDVENDRPSKTELMTITKDDLPFDENSIELNKKEGIPQIIYNDPDVCLDDESDSNNSLRKKEIDYRKEVISIDEQLEKNFSNMGDSLYKFDWESPLKINLNDLAVLEYVKDCLKTKVLLYLKYPDAFNGYVKKNRDGLFLYGPRGTGKTTIAKAIASELSAKFCIVKPSDLLFENEENTVNAVKALFEQAKEYSSAVICFEGIDSIAPKNENSISFTKLKSELLIQMHSIKYYHKVTGNLLFPIFETSRPWNIDSSFLKSEEIGVKVYVGLPDIPARQSLVHSRFDKISAKGIVKISDEINIDNFVDRTNDFNILDIQNLLDEIEEISALRSLKTGVKYIGVEDIDNAFEKIHPSVSTDYIERLIIWKELNDE